MNFVNVLAYKIWLKMDVLKSFIHQSKHLSNLLHPNTIELSLYLRFIFLFTFLFLCLFGFMYQEYSLNLLRYAPFRPLPVANKLYTHAFWVAPKCWVIPWDQIFYETQLVWLYWLLIIPSSPIDQLQNKHVLHMSVVDHIILWSLDYRTKKFTTLSRW